MLPHLAQMQAVDKAYPALKVPNDFVVTVIETDYDANSFSAILLKAASPYAHYTNLISGSFPLQLPPLPAGGGLIPLAISRPAMSQLPSVKPRVKRQRQRAPRTCGKCHTVGCPGTGGHKYCRNNQMDAENS